ncbi:tyramine receptor 1-like [Mercenaria mercenaria]|uniref:tyramine receptor 1-like n=1 Tax=Mercenaria mercenaria TaxID=6596 RepID=UPI00234E5069|nr:tyramine receptor 1-like [Mercenaria mercenaria]
MSGIVTNFAPISNVSDSAADSGQKLSTFAVVTILLQLTTMVAIVSGNTLVLVAIVRFRTLQDITGIFVANLALADLIIGLTQPFQVAFFFFPELEKNKIACLLRFQIILFACNASIYSLVCTVVDRYVAIAYPLRYPSIMTTKVAFGLVLGIWVLDICCAVIPFTENNWDTSPFCLYELVLNKYFRFWNHFGGLMFALLMFLIYIRIYFIVKKHLRQIRNEAVFHTGDQNIRGTKQMNTVVAIVVLFFHISWLPFFIIELTMFEIEHVTQTKVLVANFLVFLGVMNSIVNPIVYAWKNKQYRRAFQKLLGLKVSRNEVDSIETIA